MPVLSLPLSSPSSPPSSPSSPPRPPPPPPAYVHTEEREREDKAEYLRMEGLLLYYGQGQGEIT